MSDWYEENIEAGVREVVRLLRDNGINTTQSCHHAMLVEAESYEDNEASKIYNLLIENGYDGFEIVLTLHKERGQYLKRSFRIRFFGCPICLKG